MLSDYVPFINLAFMAVLGLDRLIWKQRTKEIVTDAKIDGRPSLDSRVSALDSTVSAVRQDVDKRLDKLGKAASDEASRLQVLVGRFEEKVVEARKDHELLLYRFGTLEKACDRRDERLDIIEKRLFNRM